MVETLAAADVEVVRDLHETDFGWEQFAVEDLNGYVRWFGEKHENRGALDVGRRHHG